jgi:Carboxypeptidase regulatory-like domain
MFEGVTWHGMAAQVGALTLLLSGALVRAQTSPGYTISGTIVNSLDGAPLGQARVSLVETRNRAQAVSIITSESGHFAFSSLAGGKFSLEGAKRGFLEGGY